MNNHTIGVFSTKEDAETFIIHLKESHDIDPKKISYIYKDPEGKTDKLDVKGVDEGTKGGAKKGAEVGAAIGAVGGLAAAAGMIPVLGPIFAAGPLLASLGIAGAAGTTAAGAVGGAVIGGLVGALVKLGVSETQAKEYEDMVNAGDVLVLVNSARSEEVETAMLDNEAREVRTYVEK